MMYTHNLVVTGGKHLIEFNKGVSVTTVSKALKLYRCKSRLLIG